MGEVIKGDFSKGVDRGPFPDVLKKEPASYEEFQKIREQRDLRGPRNREEFPLINIVVSRFEVEFIEQLPKKIQELSDKKLTPEKFWEEIIFWDRELVKATADKEASKGSGEKDFAKALRYLDALGNFDFRSTNGKISANSLINLFSALRLERYKKES